MSDAAGFLGNESMETEIKGLAKDRCPWLKDPLSAAFPDRLTLSDLMLGQKREEFICAGEMLRLRSPAWCRGKACGCKKPCRARSF